MTTMFYRVKLTLRKGQMQLQQPVYDIQLDFLEALEN